MAAERRVSNSTRIQSLTACLPAGQQYRLAASAYRVASRPVAHTDLFSESGTARIWTMPARVLELAQKIEFSLHAFFRRLLFACYDISASKIQVSLEACPLKKSDFSKQV